MAKWGEIKCPRCEMLEEHLCLTEEKLERALEMLRVLGIADAILAELKGQKDK